MMVMNQPTENLFENVDADTAFAIFDSPYFRPLLKTYWGKPIEGTLIHKFWLSGAEWYVNKWGNEYVAYQRTGTSRKIEITCEFSAALWEQAYQEIKPEPKMRYPQVEQAAKALQGIAQFGSLPKEVYHLMSALRDSGLID